MAALARGRRGPATRDEVCRPAEALQGRSGRGRGNLLAVATEVGGELHHVLDEVARRRGAHPVAPDLPHDAPQAVGEPPLRVLSPRRARRRILRRQEGSAVDEVPPTAATNGVVCNGLARCRSGQSTNRAPAGVCGTAWRAELR